MMTERNNESSPNDGGSSTDTVIGRSSSEDDAKNRQFVDVTTGGSTSGEYVTGIGESSSSLDTVIESASHQLHHRRQPSHGNLVAASLSTNAIEEVGTKKGRFDALKSTFRKIKRSKSRSIDSTENYPDLESNVDISKGFIHHEFTSDHCEESKVSSFSFVEKKDFSILIVDIACSLIVVLGKFLAVV